MGRKEGKEKGEKKEGRGGAAGREECGERKRKKGRNRASVFCLIIAIS